MSSKHADRTRYEVLRRLLEDRRREIHEKLRSLRESLPEEVAQVSDTEEQAVRDFVTDIDFALMQMKAESLTRIDEALRHLEQGSYGTCENCGGDIPAARLRALPFAVLCIPCQEREEQEASKERLARVRGIEAALGAGGGLLIRE